MTAAVVFIALATFAVTLNTDTFVGTRDSILRLPLLSHGKHIPKIFTRDFMLFTEGRYRPLSYALIALVRTIVRGDNVAHMSRHGNGGCYQWLLSRRRRRLAIAPGASPG